MTGVLTYIRDNLAGALEIMLGRPEGLARLDLSLEGFWRSFAAFVLVLPFALLALVSQGRLAALDERRKSCGRRPRSRRRAGDRFWSTGSPFRCVFALIARPLGLGPRYVPFIVARNWAAVAIGAMMAAIHAAFLIGLLPAQVTVYVLIAFIAVALRFSYVIARIALDVSMRTALPIVVADFLLSLTIWSALDGGG